MIFQKNNDSRHLFSWVACRTSEFRNWAFSEKVEILRFGPFHYQNDRQKILRLLRGDIDFSKTILIHDICFLGPIQKIPNLTFSEKVEFSNRLLMTNVLFCMFLRGTANKHPFSNRLLMKNALFGMFLRGMAKSSNPKSYQIICFGFPDPEPRSSPLFEQIAYEKGIVCTLLRDTLKRVQISLRI